mmetsp:Transcript_6666/g.22382  ORF Transcript_6666/g.22382 Transcript_6666/m.22382 type:complete len:294 (+) Transcript_6666:701-1582(+)
MLSPNTAPSSPNAKDAGTLITRRPPCRMPATPSSTPRVIAPPNRPPYDHTTCRPFLRVSNTTSPVFVIFTSTCAASKYCGATRSPPPTTTSTYDVPPAVETSRRSLASTSRVFTIASRVSRRVFNCSLTTPNVSTPSHAKPPFKPNRRVINVATASVLSARRTFARRFSSTGCAAFAVPVAIAGSGARASSPGAPMASMTSSSDDDARVPGRLVRRFADADKDSDDDDDDVFVGCATRRDAVSRRARAMCVAPMTPRVVVVVDIAVVVVVIIDAYKRKGDRIFTIRIQSKRRD